MAAQVDWMMAKPFDKHQIVEMTQEVSRRRRALRSPAPAMAA
jgi:hypothetical protein